MPLINSNSPTQVTLDGAYVYSTTPNQLPQLPNTNIGSFVGFATDGPFNTSTNFSSGNLFTVAGGETLNQFDIVTQALLYLNQANIGTFVRIKDGTETAPMIAFNTLAASGSPASLLGTFVYKYPGTAANGSFVQVVANTLSTQSAPLYDVTVQKSNVGGTIVAPAETFRAIAAPTLAAFIANLAAAINSGTQTASPSQWWTFVAGTGATGTIPTGTTINVSSLGTDTQTINTATLIGTDGNPQQRTGMYALRGTGVNAFILCGCTDRTADAQISSFIKSEQSGITMGGNGFASGTYPSTAVSQITLYPTGLFRYINWLWVPSTIPQYQTSGRLVNPGGAHLAVIVTTNPWNSIGDQPSLKSGGYSGVLGSEFTTSATGTPNLTLAQPDAYTAQQAGLLYLTTATPQKGGVYAEPHGQSAAAQTPGLDQVCEQRMAVFLALDALNILGPLVHQLQGSQPDDEFRATVVSMLQSRYGYMKKYSMIVGASVTDELAPASGLIGPGDNTPATIALGFNFVSTNVQTLSPVRFIVDTLVSGFGAQIAVTPG